MACRFGGAGAVFGLSIWMRCLIVVTRVTLEGSQSTQLKGAAATFGYVIKQPVFIDPQAGLRVVGGDWLDCWVMGW